MGEDKWGPGNDAKTAKAFATCSMHRPGSKDFELVHGEHPHSRCDNNTYARFPDGRMEPFDGHRVLIEVAVSTYNYLKTSELSGDEIRKGGQLSIKFDGYLMHQAFVRDPRRALLEACPLIDRYLEHPVRAWIEEERQRNTGRRVYWRSEPAIVQRFTGDGCVVLAPDGYLRFAAPPWRRDGGEELEQEECIRDDMLSPHIWWFRE